jgi:hypothetical protein
MPIRPPSSIADWRRGGSAASLAWEPKAGGGSRVALLCIVTRNRGKTFRAHNRTVEFGETLTRK